LAIRSIRRDLHPLSHLAHLKLQVELDDKPQIHPHFPPDERVKSWPDDPHDVFADLECWGSVQPLIVV